jgi:hypothetical protein
MMPSITTAETIVPVVTASPALRATADRLRDRTHEILCATLEYHGTVLSKGHRAALFDLCDVLADTAVHVRGGRRAMPYPTGLGKTSAIVALCKAIHEQNPIDANGNPVSVSICASQIRHLQNLVRDMVAAGVDPSWIGIKYKKDYPENGVPSTEDEDHRIQLVTHQRLRTDGKNDLALYTLHEDKPRSVCIYDESWLAHDVKTIGVIKLAMINGSLGASPSRDPTFLNARQYVTECSTRVSTAMSTPDPKCEGVPLCLPPLSEVESKVYTKALRGGLLAGEDVTYLEDLFSLAGEAMRACALPGGSGGGALWIDLAISPAVQSVVILDASYSIRPLTNMSVDVWDGSVGKDFAAVKSWVDVDVRTIRASGARSAIEKNIKSARTPTSSTFAREVVAEVRKVWDTTAGCLIFTYLAKQGKPNMVKTITDALRENGMDIHDASLFVNGKPRVVIETFGNEASINLYSYCDHVVFAGLLHLNDLTVAGGIRGAKADLAYPTPLSLVQQVSRCERGSTLFQGLSRGRSRVMHNGKAGKMSVVVIDSAGEELEEILRPVMPGATWSHEEPKHMDTSKAKQHGRKQEMLARIIAYLRGLDPEVNKVSAKVVKKALDLDANSNAERLAFVAAGESITRASGWYREGRSFCRVGTAKDLGFHNEEILDAATAF